MEFLESYYLKRWKYLLAMTSQSNEDIRDFVPDKPMGMVDEIMRVLNENPEMAYRVYLLLAIKYGAGQML